MIRATGPLLIVLCCALWATDTLVRVPLLERIDGGTVVFVEHLVALLAMSPLFFRHASDLRKMSLRNWGAISFIGVVGSAIATLCLTLSYSMINPSVAILLQKLQPIITIGGARFFLGEKPEASFYAIAAFAILGAVLLSAPELASLSDLSIDGPETFFKGIALALTASFAWGLSTVFGRHLSSHVSRETTTWLRFAFGFLGLVAIRLSRGESLGVASTLDGTAIAGCLYVGLISGVLAMNFYYAGLSKTTASKAAVAELSFPLLSIVLNWVILGKSLQALQLLGGAILVTAVLLISLSKRSGSGNPLPA